MNDDWFQLLEALKRQNVRFLVIGAHAMAVHGVLRSTQDLDVWVEPVAENAQRVWKALAAFGAPLSALDIKEADFVREGTVVQLGLPPNRIDLLTAISGVESFAAAWATHVEHEIRGQRISFIGRDVLIANKRASGRTKDLADIEALGG